MKSRKQENLCKTTRLHLAEIISGWLLENSPWIQRHLTTCPRCRQRLIGFNRLSTALALLKTYPHQLDLLSQANTQAIKILKHSLRNSSHAQILQKAQPEPKWFKRLTKYAHSLANAAACITILLMIRTGIFSSMDKLQNEGQKSLKQYYARQLGEEVADELFKA